ncbi:MAG: hypothetical protein WCO71_10235 [Pseudomonadota bacterium]
MDQDLFGKKLAQYAGKKPKHFLQIDGFYYGEGYDGYFSPDGDGDSIKARSTVELMDGAAVRVLIPIDTNPFVAARLIKKIAKRLEQRPELIDLAKQEPEKNHLLHEDSPF